MQPLGVASCTRGHATLQTLPTHMNAPMYAQFSMNRIVVAMTMMGSVTCHRNDSYQNRKMYCDGDGRGTKRALNGLEAMLRWSSTARSENKPTRTPQSKGPKIVRHNTRNGPINAATTRSAHRGDTAMLEGHLSAAEYLGHWGYSMHALAQNEAAI
jgi:hypothetical protein